LSDLLNIGRTGLGASKKSLETTGHNIANANTEGFSRQRVNQTTNVPISKSGLIHGTGVRVKSVTRVHDDFVEKRLNTTTSNSEFFKERQLQLTRVEDIFNEIDNDGLNKVLNKFYNSFRDLANQPENETVRSVVRDNAKLVVKDFKRIRSELDSVARGIDHKLGTEVESVNQTIRNIAKLNQRIAALEAIHEETGDLRDQRDLGIRNLAKSFDVHTYVDEKGQYVVSARGVGTLVAGTETQELVVGALSADRSSNGMPGASEVYFKNRPTLPMTNKFKKGAIASLVKARNTDVFDLQKNVDKIAFEFVNTVNAVHRRGYANRELKTDAEGNVRDFDNKGATTGINFFKAPQEIKGAAENISLSDEVLDDLSNIATALDANSPGDNRVAVAISKLQHEKVMDEGTTTLEESFLQTIGKIGLEAGKAHLDAEQSEGILAQTKNLRERISGVSIDEETANMVKFQHAYEAAAKVMQTADEMFATVIGIKR